MRLSGWHLKSGPKSATLADYDLGGPVAAVIAAGQSCDLLLNVALEFRPPDPAVVVADSADDAEEAAPDVPPVPCERPGKNLENQGAAALPRCGRELVEVTHQFTIDHNDGIVFAQSHLPGEAVAFNVDDLNA